MWLVYNEFWMFFWLLYKMKVVFGVIGCFKFRFFGILKLISLFSSVVNEFIFICIFVDVRLIVMLLFF